VGKPQNPPRGEAAKQKPRKPEPHRIGVHAGASAAAAQGPGGGHRDRAMVGMIVDCKRHENGVGVDFHDDRDKPFLNRFHAVGSSAVVKSEELYFGRRDAEELACPQRFTPAEFREAIGIRKIRGMPPAVGDHGNVHVHSHGPDPRDSRAASERLVVGMRGDDEAGPAAVLENEGPREPDEQLLETGGQRAADGRNRPVDQCGCTTH
jgi:hypothetical protein